MWSTRVCQCDEFVEGNDYLCAVCRLLPPAPRGYIPPKQPTSAEMVGMKLTPGAQAECEWCCGTGIDGHPDSGRKCSCGGVAFKTGDSLSIAGTFKRRSFWQWLTRKPRQLLTFTVVDNLSSLETEERSKVEIRQAIENFKIKGNDAHFPIVCCTACDRNMIWVEITNDSARCCCDNCGQIFKIVPESKINPATAWEKAAKYPVVQATFGEHNVTSEN